MEMLGLVISIIFSVLTAHAAAAASMSDEQVFNNSMRGEAYRSLLNDCLTIRLGKANMCDHMETPSFAFFVDYVARRVPAGKSLSTVTAWKLRCMSGIHLRDPPVCWAAAYLRLPMPLDVKPKSINCLDPADVETSQRDPTRLSLEKDITEYKFKLFVVETRQLGSHACTLLRSTCGLQIEMTILGQGLGKVRRSKKLELVSEAVRKIPPAERSKTIVLNMDSSDAYLQLNVQEIMRKFISTGSKFLFSTEGDCFPFRYFPMSMGLGSNTILMSGDATNRYNQFHVCGTMFEHVHGSEARWLNSGSWIGYADAILNAYTALDLYPSWFINRWPGSDQGFFTTLFLSRKYDIELDVCNEIFVTFKSIGNKMERRYNSFWDLYTKGPSLPAYNKVYLRKAEEISTLEQRTSDEDVGAGNYSRANTQSPYQYLWINKRTQRTPAVLHFNGDSFKAHDWYLENEIHDETQLVCKAMKKLEVTQNMTVDASHHTCKVALENQCFQRLQHLKKIGCYIEDEDVEDILVRNRSGVGFFNALSPVKFFSPFSHDESRKLALSLGMKQMSAHETLPFDPDAEEESSFQTWIRHVAMLVSGT